MTMYIYMTSRFSTAKIFHTKVFFVRVFPHDLLQQPTPFHDTPLPGNRRLSAPSLGVAPRIVDVASLQRHDRGQRRHRKGQTIRLMVFRNPQQPPGMYKTWQNNGTFTSLPYQLEVCIYIIYISDDLPVSDGSNHLHW